jgi:hypothetical protein
MSVNARRRSIRRCPGYRIQVSEPARFARRVTRVQFYHTRFTLRAKPRSSPETSTPSSRICETQSVPHFWGTPKYYEVFFCFKTYYALNDKQDFFLVMVLGLEGQ